MGEGERVLCTPSSHFACGGVIVLPVCSFLFLSCFGVGTWTTFPSKTRSPKVIFICLFVLIKDPPLLWWKFSGPGFFFLERFSQYLQFLCCLWALWALHSSPRELWWDELWCLRRFKRRFEQQSGWVTEAEQRTLKTEFMYLRGAKWQKTVVGKKVSWLRVLWDSKVNARYEGIKVSAGL